MLNKLKIIFQILKDTPNDGYYFKNISNSVITIIKRSSFKIDNKWFENLLTIYYDDEIKSKYIPELHQDNNFKREHLTDILNFNKSHGDFINQIEVCLDYIKRFNNSYRDFYQYLRVEGIKITEINSIYLKRTTEVFDNLESYKIILQNLDKIFRSKGYEILQFSNQINTIKHGIPNVLSFNKNNWNLLLDKEPQEEHILRYLFQHHNQVYNTLNELNMMLSNYKKNRNHKIIVGKAGMGKSHMTAHLIKKIRRQEDFVIFLKPKFFNGDNINFEERFLQLLQVPTGYTLDEILIKLNEFSKSKGKRSFIIIDALNETTKSHIGFSDVWKISLQSFINQINTFSNLYFICTLRNSYIENIWDSIPNGLAEIKGFNKVDDVKEACNKYFGYYKIKPLNIETADLSSFEVPLLLDLFCKLTNGNRSDLIEITIDINSYLKVFEDYINKLKAEVKTKLNLQLNKPIEDGFHNSSAKFLENNDGQLLTDDFSISFDTNPLVRANESIARAVLEGYLIFIKDFVGKPNEIVKHTQQEVGGYLLAKKLVTDYPNTSALVNSAIFQNKIIGTVKDEQHQLRFDILKFLIALKPDIIDYTESIEVLNLSWWYLYNGFNSIQNPGFDKKILLNPNNEKITNEILNISSNNWFNNTNKLNFEFISELLKSYDLWSYDLKWNYFVYQLGNEAYTFIEDTILELREDKTDIKELKIKAKFIAFILSTNIRELRDLATKFFIEFGKKNPLELLELTNDFSNFHDIYIYERLVSCCYGVMMVRQNDTKYIQEFLPKIANELFELQFSENPKAPKYNYIVLDSIKHLLDFASAIGAIDFSIEQYAKINNYEFVPPYKWKPPTEEQQVLINSSHEMSWPNPIGMDFGIYTIPRLVKRDEDHDRRKAIANVYKRIYELGYEELDLRDSKEEEFKEFVWGYKIYGIDGKVDRLGKKYSWIAFFDYAGYLLLNKKLNVFDKTDNGKKYFSRLGDVDIDISFPNTKYDINLRLYNCDLLKARVNNPKWYEEIKIDSIKELFETKLEDNYSMLYGFVEQRIGDDYKVRSFLMVETLFIEKNKDFEKLKKESDVMDWSSDIHVSRDHSRNSYFGELYWADTIPDSEKNDVYIPTGEKITYKRKRTIHDIFRDKQYKREEDDLEIEETSDKTISFNSEATLIDYLWESDSKLLNGFGEYFPSGKMGKYLGLKADCTTGKILDKELKEAYKCIHYEDKSYFKNTFNYMRSDLVKKYMADNNLALLYQVKQHSYDEDLLHNRKLKFFIVE